MTGVRRWWDGVGVTAQRQLTTTAIAVVGLGLAATGAVTVTAPAVAVAGVVVLLAVDAAVLTSSPEVRRRGVVPLAVPLACILALGLVRAGTGELASPFGLLLVLPSLAVGAQARTRRPIGLVALATELVVVLPYLVLPDPSPLDGPVLVRALSTPLVCTVAALAVNSLTQEVRRRAEAQRSLQHTQDALVARLEGARNAYASIIDAVTEQSIVATDLDGRVRVFNPGAEKLLGARRADVVGRARVTDFHRLDELTDTGGRDPFEVLVAEARAGTPTVRELSYVTGGGEEVPMKLAVTPRMDDADGHVGYLFVGTDVTEDRQAAAVRDQFVSLISHELRTPLSSILGYLELVTDDPDQPLTDEQERFLGVVARNAQRLLHLVGDLLFTAQVDAGRLSLTDTDVDLGAVARAAVDTARPTAERAGVTVSVTAPPGPVAVRGDPVRLGQACDNLISNAVKFTPRHGSVRVCLEPDPTGVVLSVTDTGVGIAAEDVDRLATRFFRAGTATRNAVPGVGLGLSITRAIVTAHGGELGVRSTEGVGTTFTLRLPVTPVTP